MERRTFISFLGAGTIGAALAPKWSWAYPAPFTIKSLNPSDMDALTLAEGLDFQVLIKYGDPINAKRTFGYNNDYIAFFPGKSADEATLWVNHEYMDPMFVSGYVKGTPKTLEQVEKEMEVVGGSILRLKKKNGHWTFVSDDPVNRRLDANTHIPFHWHEPIANSMDAIGTLGNCAGGITPWNTVLTCEENYDDYYGERESLDAPLEPGMYQWHLHKPYPTEHYGWVVEVNPATGEAQKHVALGRCAHECATVVELEDGRVVVYSGDDKENECLYKFIGSKPRSLSEGTLYVANMEQGRWIPIDIEQSEALKLQFGTQTEALIRLRKSASIVGGTPLDRPEDIEKDPLTGHILVALTNNVPKGNHFGSILKIKEEGNRYDSLHFTHETFLTGGEETGFACPDNLAFDTAGNLWFTCDVGGSALHKEPYTSFGNNSLFVVPRHGADAGKPIRVVNGPMGAELSGPCFTPDGKTLFLSVQHPGEKSPSADNPISHWPDGGTATPKPAVVAIYGEALNKLQGLS
ncbi:MAG: DUF839 domain-containing protein [Flavobacteriales bacterium]|nr:DUF839 domain-containing protein [Flavobacteriales bacterium]MCB9447339.1 DUF839 domain-containing protein [Flavobacteriales bacterium]